MKQSIRRRGLLGALSVGWLWLGVAMADGTYPGALTCDSSLTHAIAQFRDAGSGAVTQSTNESACAQHPWIKRLKDWADRGMTLPAAMALATQTDPSPVRDDLPDGLQDIANLIAAHTLAQSGYLREAEFMWLQLTRQRQSWPEPWLNLALLHAQRGNAESSHRALAQAARRCQSETCRHQHAAILALLQTHEEKPNAMDP